MGNECSKVVKRAVWHEYGHLFSYKLVEKITKKKIKIVQLRLKNEKENPFIKSDCKDYIFTFLSKI